MRSDYTKAQWAKLPWEKKVIRGQEAIVPGFGMGRVEDFGHEIGYDYIVVRFYAPVPAGIKHFAAEAVSLIDPCGLILTPYKAKTSAPKKRFGPTPIQSRAFPSPRFRVMP